MKELCRKYKSEIIVGIIVWVITTTLFSFGKWLVVIAPSVGNSIFETYSNLICYMAATHSDGFTSMVLVSLVFGALLGTVIIEIKIGLTSYKKFYNYEKEISKTLKKDFNEVENEIVLEQEGESDNEYTKTLIKKGKKNSIIVIIIGIIFISLFSTIYISIAEPRKLYANFEQDIIKIAPYVEEIEITQLKSDWVCMRSKSDYEEIYVIIDEVKEKHSLPK